jgi:dihydroorotase
LPIVNIKVGEKANLTIFNPNEEWIFEKSNIKSKSKNLHILDISLKENQNTLLTII